VAHAIASATGVWVKDLPITPEKILNALKNREAATGEKRYRDCCGEQGA